MITATRGVLDWIQKWLFPPGETAPRPAERQRPEKTEPLPATKRYQHMTRSMLERHGVRVRRWRKSMSGVAWCVEYADGHVSRLIEAPLPRSPISAAIFLHEIGHHAIGLGTYRPRCLEEYHAWRFALDAMREHRIDITPKVEYRMHASLHYAVHKALRRGLRQLPHELNPYTSPPPRRLRRLALGR